MCYLGIFELSSVHALLHHFNRDDSPRINRAQLYKDLKVSDLQANARLVQKAECQF